MTTFALGATARLSTEVRDDAGTLVDPSGITVTILLPDGTTSGPHTPTNSSTGVYYYDCTTAQAGRHIARWVTSGNAVGIDEETFDVAPIWGEAGVVSLAEAKAQLNITVTTHDDEIAGFVRAATDVCERHVGSVARRTIQEKHAGGWRMALNRAPVLSVTSVEAIRTGGTDLTVSDLDLDKPTGVIERLDGAYMPGPYRITYVAGRTEVPAHVRLAALIIIQHLWHTQRGTSGGVRTGGTDEVYDPRTGYAIPRRALELLGDQPPVVA